MVATLIVPPGVPADLERRNPRDTLGLPGKEEAGKLLDGLLEELSSLQERLYAEGRRSVLLVLQGLDASGKDGTIRRVFTGVNPQGCHVTSFKAPSPVELAHDFLWRIHAQCPARRMIGIFNRSHYEDVVTVGVLGLAPEEVWRRRPERIVEFERLLADEGTTVLKCFLHVSQEEQRERFAERLADPTKRWKHNLKDEETSRRFGVRGCLRGGSHRHLDGVGALVRDPGGPQLGAEPCSRDRARRGAATARPPVPRARELSG